MIDVKAELERGHSLQPPKRWPTYDGGELDRAQYVTSSEIGNCARRIKFEKGYMLDNGPLPFPNWGYAERGHLIEAWFIATLKAAGHKIRYAGAEQVSFVAGVQSGTPDGVIVEGTNDDERTLLEVKSIDPRFTIDKLPKDPHVLQLHQNMDLVAATLGRELKGGVLCYVNASNLQIVHQFNYEPDHEEQERLQKRAESIASASWPGQLTAEGIFTGDCDNCAFTKECSKIVSDEFHGLDTAGKGVFK